MLMIEEVQRRRPWRMRFQLPVLDFELETWFYDSAIIYYHAGHHPDRAGTPRYSLILARKIGHDEMQGSLEFRGEKKWKRVKS